MDWGPRRHNEWLAYFPDDGQTIEDATFILKAYDAEDAAHQAVEYDFDSRGGWERGETSFAVVVVSPQGQTIEFVGWNEPTVSHKAKRVAKRQIEERSDTALPTGESLPDTNKATKKGK